MHLLKWLGGAAVGALMFAGVADLGRHHRLLAGGR